MAHLAAPMNSSTSRTASAVAPPLTVQFPEQGFGRVSARPEQVLLLCFYDPTGISTVPETVAFMQKASRYSVTVLNLFEHRIDSGYLRLHPWIRLQAFDAVVIHNSVSYSIDNLRRLDEGLEVGLRDYKGVKVLLKQDENYRFRELAAWMGEVGFDIVFTCLPPESVPIIYPAEVVGTPRFERMLTGYVTPTLRSKWQPGSERTVDIGYRGSIQPLSFGWLAYEKRKIGDDVADLLRDKGLALDISSRWEDRLGGEAWFDFLRSCKATLGAESGASIFDLAGDLDARCTRLESEASHLPDEKARSEAVLTGLRDLENNVHYHQVSPRHFEAAACGAVQLLFPGEYSGLLAPGRHYFELARDYGNLDEAVEFIRNDVARMEMAERAWREVVLDRGNWIETFVQKVDSCLADALQAKGLERTPAVCASPAVNVLLIAAHDPVVDPRLGWIEEGAPEPLRVHQLGVLRSESDKPKVEATVRGNLLLAFPRQPSGAALWARFAHHVAQSGAGTAAVNELLSMAEAVDMSEDKFCRLFGAPPGAPRNAQFRWYLQYILDISASLLDAASRMRGIHAVIATDLDALPAALLLKGLFGVPVVYDAHEYWPEADASSLEFERDFWVGMERRLAALADHRVTVSDGLARFMARQYGLAFGSVPNSEPANRLLPARPVSMAGKSCHFLFQGSFAVGRGIDLLIKHWSETDPVAVLHLRGPENDYRAQMVALAESTGLLGSRIFFPDAVAEDQMIAKAAEADVGLIPYTAISSAYKYCCPNKLSQYMAAGLPILANDTEFVAQTVRAAGCGMVVDFSRREQLLRAVARFCADPDERGRWGAAGREFFRRDFNWDINARPLYQELHSLTASCHPQVLALYDACERDYLRVPPPDPELAPPEPVRPSLREVVSVVWRWLPASIRLPLRPIGRSLRWLVRLLLR